MRIASMHDIRIHLFFDDMQAWIRKNACYCR